MEKQIHGGNIYDKEVSLDFSVNINPLGMPDGVQEAILNYINGYETYPTRMYYFTDQRCTAVLPWNCRRVSCQDVYGGKKSSNLSCKRGTIAYAAESGQYYRTGL